jgi:hypothetical protein
MNRRTFTGMMVAGAASPSPLWRCYSSARAKCARYCACSRALASCWSEIITRLQPKGMQATAVQTLLTTLQETIETTQHALALRQGPAVLVAHSLASTIVTEAGADPTVSALIYVATRAPDPGADYPALANGFPTTPVVAISSRVAGAKHTLGRSPMSAKCAQRNSWSPRSIAGAARQGGEVTISSAARTARTVRLSRLRRYSNLRRSVVREHPAEPRMRSSTICGRSRSAACRMLSGMQLPIAREASATKSPTMLVSAGVSANPMISSPSSQTTSENVTCRRVRYLARHSGVMEM